MKKFEEVAIPGIEGHFQIVQLPATQAYFLLLELISMVVPSAAKGLGGGTAGINLGELDMGQLAEGLEGFFQRANRTKVEAITKELFSTVEHVTDVKRPLTKQNLDVIFQGNVLGIFHLQKEALRVNYASFFDALAPQLMALVAKARADKGEPARKARSAGLSGDSSPSNELRL